MASIPKLKPSVLIKDIIKDPDRKPVIKIISEILSLTFYHRSFPRHYFARYLFKMDRTNIRDYYPDKYLYGIKAFFNDKEVIDVLENKLYFDFYYSQFNISLPAIVMYNHKNLFVVAKKGMQVNNTSDFKILLQDLFNQNPVLDSIIIKRTYGSYGGDSVYKLFRHQVASDNEVLAKLYTEIVNAGFLFQQTVKQHPDLNALNSSGLNTIRFDTFIDKSGMIEILSGYLRTSTNNHYVDNASSGGFMVGVDLDTGKLAKTGYSSFTKVGVKVLNSHPVTNVIFEDFQIPFFNQAKQIVIDAAGLMPGLRLVGWDVAIGENGPVLIEGNSDYNIRGNEMNSGGYRANPVFKKILSELNQGKNGSVD